MGPPPDASDRGLIDAVRTAFSDAGYEPEPIYAWLGLHRMQAMDADRYAPLLERTAGMGPVGTLIRLFLAGIPVAMTAAEQALGPAGVDGWTRAGLVARHGDRVHPAVLIRPVPGTDVLLACDVGKPDGRQPDYVLGDGPATAALAAHTIRAPAARVLDLGTGGGMLSLLAARHAETVVATDVSARALGFAAFNAVLNAADNIELRHGSWFDPVEGEEFDLVVANPPWVVSPDSGLVYRDAGMVDDDVSAMVTAGVAAHLAPGGIGHQLACWIHRDGEPWQERVGAWVTGTGCDAIILQWHVDDPAAYALRWVDSVVGSGAEIDQRYARWMTYFRQRGIDGLGFGLITLRRPHRGGARFIVAEEPAETPDRPAEVLARRLAAEDWLATHQADEDIAASRLRLWDTSALVGVHRRGEGGWAPANIELQSPDTWVGAAPLTESEAAALAQCDGRATVAESLGTVALSTIRRLVRAGFLIAVAD